MTLFWRAFANRTVRTGVRTAAGRRGHPWPNASTAAPLSASLSASLSSSSLSLKSSLDDPCSSCCCFGFGADLADDCPNRLLADDFFGTGGGALFFGAAACESAARAPRQFKIQAT